MIKIPRSKEANQRIHEEQRLKITQAAWKVFARKGMSVTVADVAAAAGVSYGLVYHYYSNKEAILYSLVEQAIEIGQKLVEDIQKMDDTPSKQIKFIISELLISRRDHPEINQIIYQVLSSNSIPEYLSKLAVKQQQDIQELTKQIIIEGQNTGEFAKDDPEQMITALFACLDGLARLAISDLKQSASNFPDVEIIMRMLKPNLD